MAEILFVSLIHILQNPDLYDGKPVRVVGYAAVRFEAQALYVSEQDARNAVTKNALWLDVQVTEPMRKLNDKFVLVEGVFSKSELGHLRMYSGTIKQVTRLEAWSDPKRPVNPAQK